VDGGLPVGCELLDTRSQLAQQVQVLLLLHLLLSVDEHPRLHIVFEEGQTLLAQVDIVAFDVRGNGSFELVEDGYRVLEVLLALGEIGHPGCSAGLNVDHVEEQDGQLVFDTLALGLLGVQGEVFVVGERDVVQRDLGLQQLEVLVVLHAHVHGLALLHARQILEFDSLL